MGRLARRWLGRGVYHVYNRAHGGAWVLAEPELKRQFLDRLVRFLPRQEMQVYHWAVMGNHFHLAAARGASRRRWCQAPGFRRRTKTSSLATAGWTTSRPEI